MTGLFDRVLVPVANPDDAAATAAALAPYLDADTEVVAVVVVEKAGGAPDKASVEQREAVAAEAFEAFRDALDRTAETEVRYGTDVVDAILAAAADHGATAVAFLPRPGGRVARFLSGDLSLRLVTACDRPVLALPGDDG